MEEEEARRRSRVARQAELDSLYGERREKVEDDLDIGANLSKISQRRKSEAEDNEGIQG